jgi:hypothetical protein
VKSLSSHSPVSCLPTFPASFAVPKQSLLWTTPAAKNHQSYTQPKHTRTSWPCVHSKGRRISLRLKEDKVRCSGNVHQVCRQHLALQMHMHFGVRDKLLGIVLAMASRTYKTCSRSSTNLFSSVESVGLSGATSPSNAFYDDDGSNDHCHTWPLPRR